MVGHSNGHEMFPMPVWLRVIVTKSRRIARYVKDTIVIQFMPATNYPVIREAFEIEQSDNKRMIVFKLYGLRIEANSSSSFILGLCNGGRSTREIITVIANEFDMPRHVIGRHVRMLIRQLLKSRLVVLYNASSPPPFVVLPTGTVIKREVEAAVRFRMGRFYEQTNPFDDTLLESHFNNHLLLKFSRGKLIYKNNSNHSNRSNWFIDSLNKLNIPLADFWVIFAGHDGADNHHTIPIYGQSRVTGSDSTILWPLKGYTTIQSKNFGQNIDKSDCDWKQKKRSPFGAVPRLDIPSKI